MGALNGDAASSGARPGSNNSKGLLPKGEQSKSLTDSLWNALDKGNSIKL